MVVWTGWEEGAVDDRGTARRVSAGQGVGQDLFRLYVVSLDWVEETGH